MTSQKLSCRAADNILDLMDKVRAALVPLRGQEYAELAAFESCMLNWEALIKLNRAVLLEQSRSFSQRSTGNLNRLNKRASMYHVQHSPSALSDELDEPVFENDSGIDSMRQNFSPYRNDGMGGDVNGFKGDNGQYKLENAQYKRENGFYQPANPSQAGYNIQNGSYSTKNGQSYLTKPENGYINQQQGYTSQQNLPYNNISTISSPYSPQTQQYHQNLPNTTSYSHRQDSSYGGTASRGPAQRRFKQFKERRKSLGIVLDSDYDRFFGAYNEGTSLSRQPSTVGSSPDTQRKESTATGNYELDLCLEHHTKHSLEVLSELKKQKGPFEYQLGLLLNQIELNTLALDEMLKIAEQLPSPINIGTLLRELSATPDQQDVWIGTARAVQQTILVPAERLRMNLISFMTPIVENCYPNLVERVADSLMALISNSKDNMISVFEFTALFQGKLMGPFVENLAHEAFITSSLESKNINLIRDVMDRLKKVPIVPPLESLRFVAKVLLTDSQDCCNAVERYLNYASGGLKIDLAASFCSLLEHKQLESRMGACRALSILKQDNTLELLDCVAKQDEDPNVRKEALEAFESIQRFFGDYNEEITKI
ncbi:unnamed protein product [Bursaphelenchus okinawaensis]|uniref:Uncharacterized protein n=1 Tax=Bursaphelenchus okinawaensis TaxID=465554 RepID=A0A811L177_9BILA|nr:unnamed protein product [Bursaphelenchus okinawaensis]CAG9114899.1 unnamed protein product [Bursaphelenchus okinawaensis]